MRDNSFLLVLLVLILLGCDTATQIKMNADAGVINLTEMDSMPFRYLKKLIVVDAWLENEQDSSSFIYDTGAFYSKIEKRLSERLHLPTIFRKSNSTAQRITRNIEMTAIPMLRFNTAVFENIAAGKLVYDDKSYSPCVAGDGIIGANLIKLQNWKVDFEAQRLYFSSKPFKGDFIHEDNTFEFQTKFLSGIPTVELQIQGKTISNVMFDVGFNGGLVLPMNLAKEFKSDKTSVYLDQSTAGIFGSNLDTLLVKQLPVKLAGKSHKVIVEFSSLNKALLGNDILEHFDVYLNYEDEQITLVQKSQVATDAPSEFIPGIINDTLWVVNRTTPNLPYKIGDTLTSINGKQPKDVFKNHCDYFFNVHHLIASDSLIIE